jgi:hypothetical protein
LTVGGHTAGAPWTGTKGMVKRRAKKTRMVSLAWSLAAWFNWCCRCCYLVRTMESFIPIVRPDINPWISSFSATKAKMHMVICVSTENQSLLNTRNVYGCIDGVLQMSVLCFVNRYVVHREPRTCISVVESAVLQWHKQSSRYWMDFKGTLVKSYHQKSVNLRTKNGYMHHWIIHPHQTLEWLHWAWP